MLRNRGWSRRRIEESEGLWRLRLSDFNLLHGRNGFRGLRFRLILLRRQLLLTRFGLGGFAGSVHLGLRSVERAFELQVSGDEVDDGGWQVPIKLFGGAGELEGRCQRGILTILQLLR